MTDYRFERRKFEDRARHVLVPEPPGEPMPGEAVLGDRVNGDVVRPAAVLVPVVARDNGLTVLLTQRSEHLPNHAGQVAFPGGKIDAGDDGPLGAALRETREETGIAERFVTPVGYLPGVYSGTGFFITPVVATLDTGFLIRPEPGEVDDIFEVPLPFLMDPGNHARKEAVWKGRKRSYLEMPYGDHYIWGITAGILRLLYDKMSGHE